jgi:hypothetical protein
MEVLVIWRINDELRHANWNVQFAEWRQFNDNSEPCECNRERVISMEVLKDIIWNDRQLEHWYNGGLLFGGLTMNCGIGL